MAVRQASGSGQGTSGTCSPAFMKSSPGTERTGSLGTSGYREEVGGAEEGRLEVGGGHEVKVGALVEEIVLVMEDRGLVEDTPLPKGDLWLTRLNQCWKIFFAKNSHMPAG